jgi:hypothetical protein
MSLEQRIERLERGAKRWRLAAIALGLLLLVSWGGMRESSFLAPGVAGADEPKRTRFDLVAASELRVKYLTFEDESGKYAGGISPSKHGVSLNLRKADCTFGTITSDSIFVSDDEGSVLISGKGVALSAKDPAMILKLKRLAEREQNGEKITQEERHSIVSRLSKPTISLSGGSIDVYNPLGKVVVSVQANKTNRGGVYVGDANGNVRRTLTAD